MAQSENILWDILNLMRGQTFHWDVSVGNNTNHNKVENCRGISYIKSQLVLKYLPPDIEDTIYFMKYRNYLIVHGQGMIMPELAYSMTEKAITVFDEKEIPIDEKEAFKESLWNIEPKLYGIGPNITAWKKLMKKFKGS